MEKGGEEEMVEVWAKILLPERLYTSQTTLLTLLVSTKEKTLRMGLPHDEKMLLSTVNEGFGNALTVMEELKVVKTPGAVSTLQTMFFGPAEL